MIGIVTEGNNNIGMGHLTRCMAISDGLKKEEKNTLFFLSFDSDVSAIEAAGMNCIQMQQQAKSGWDMEELMMQIKPFDIDFLIIDSYRFSDAMFQRLKKKYKIIYIDDLETYGCNVDVLINFNIEADDKKYSDYPSNERRVYTGAEYYPLRSEFWGKRNDVLKEKVEHVLITSGSTDPYECVLHILDSINPDEWKNIEFSIILGKYYSQDYINELTQTFIGKRNVHFLPWGGSIVKIMSSADIVISPGSSMVVEALSLNVPCMTYQFADNHHETCIELERRGMASFLGTFPDGINEEEIRRHFVEELSLNKRKRESINFSKIYDSKGLIRLIDIFIKELKREKSNERVKNAIFCD